MKANFNAKMAKSQQVYQHISHRIINQLKYLRQLDLKLQNKINFLLENYQQ